MAFNWFDSGSPSATPLLAFISASLKSTFVIVDADMSSASIIGIPACRSVLNVLAKLAHAVFVCSTPNTGILSLSLSTLCLPASVFTYILYPTTIAAITAIIMYQ